MSCSCIKGVYDFKVESINTRTLIYTDLSDWMTDEPYVIPDKHKITISLPVTKKEITIYVTPGSSTIITSEMLGVKNCLPDGVYCFSTWGCFNCGLEGEKKYSKSVVITPRLDCELINLFALEDYEKIYPLYARLKSINAIGSLGMIEKAAKNFSQLKKDVSKYNCKLCLC